MMQFKISNEKLTEQSIGCWSSDFVSKNTAFYTFALGVWICLIGQASTITGQYYSNDSITIKTDLNLHCRPELKNKYVFKKMN